VCMLCCVDAIGRARVMGRTRQADFSLPPFLFNLTTIRWRSGTRTATVPNSLASKLTTTHTKRTRAFVPLGWWGWLAPSSGCAFSPCAACCFVG